MRVLIVTQYFWPENFRINDLVRGLTQRGHEIVVLTGMPNYPGGTLYPGYRWFSPAEERFEGVRVVRVPVVTRGPKVNWRLAINYLSFVVSASLLGPFRCRGRYDAILVYEPSPVTVALPAIFLSRLKRAPLLLWVQDLWPESLSATGWVRSPLILRRVRALVDFIYRHCARILVSSRGFVGHVLASGIAPERVLYLPNWAESFFRPLGEPPPSAAQELPRGFRILYAGNIGSAQSFETVLGAAERTRAAIDLHWILMGDGNTRGWVEAEIRRRGLADRVHLLPSRPADTMPGYFAAADALLVTLNSDPLFSLTVPSKMQPYLACARPILAALNGEGARIVTESGSGIAVAAEDPQRLAHAALELYRMSPAEREAMGRRGRACFEQEFDRELNVARLDGWLAKVAAEGRCAS